MSDTDIGSGLSDALQRLVALPILGEITTSVWNALGISALAEQLMSKMIDKAEATKADGQIHSFMLLAPVPEGLLTATFVITWPTALANTREQAMQAFSSNANAFLERDGLAGVLQFDVFLGSDATDIRLAWQPAPKAIADLPHALRRAVFPWGRQEKPEAAEAVTSGAEIITLADAAWELVHAMQQRYRNWPQEDGPPPREGFQELRAPFKQLVPKFNRAVKRAGLEHTMPVEDFDPTWLPHNLANALRFRSIEGSLRAELLRVWGTDARDRFDKAWELFEKASPGRPAEEALATIADPPLVQQPTSRPSAPAGPVDVFVSYAWSDKTRGARDIYEMLAGSGRSVWLDEEQRIDATGVDNDITEALRRSRFVVICLSTEMLTRGGYALREILISASWIPDRCILARLDSVPVPPFLSGIRSVEWFDRSGPEALLRMLDDAPDSASHIPSLPFDELLRHPKSDALVQPLQRDSRLKRVLNLANRKHNLELRGRLFGSLLQIWHEFYERDDWAGIINVASYPSDLLPWTLLSGPACSSDPTVFGAAVRLRSALLRARIQSGAHSDWEIHNRIAFDLLEELITSDATLFSPAPEIGWAAENARLAGQDCLDCLRFVQDWFRGWSPKMLVTMCGVPAKSAATIEERVQLRLSLLGQTMLALRAYEDRDQRLALLPPWSTIWTSSRRDLLDKLHGGTHPATIAYFQELSRYLDENAVEQLAVAIADGVIETIAATTYREEVLFPFEKFTMRCVIRCYRAPGNKRESLASVHGTVLADLKDGAARDADLNILLSMFAHPPTVESDWRYGLYLNCMANRDRPSHKNLPPMLLNPYNTADMLTEQELREVTGESYNIYDAID